jgi:guanosine-3',5'-bis(diphosphate) 3'-pyrophosphohydrolase
MSDVIDIGLACKLSEPMGRARRIAKALHLRQRYGEKPYIAHLDAVAEMLLLCHEDLSPPSLHHALEIAYLHDVIEDIPSGREDLEHFRVLPGRIDDIAALSRGEKSLEDYYTGILRRMRPVVAVKVADRIANLSESIHGQPSLRRVKKYLGERGAFHLMRVHELPRLWGRLDATYAMAEQFLTPAPQNDEVTQDENVPV